ncbi:MAG: pilus assembly protein PilM [Planctomycetes bacterium]|nr:pilus assembly protein PilM [Planctomycetota bacterium]
MTVPQTVWSLDVGKSSLKAVKVHRERNSLEILAVDKINYRCDSNGVDSAHQSKDAIRTFAQRNVINCPVIASHPGHSAFSRFIQLPPVDSKKLVEMIGYEAQQQIPFPIAEVIWDYHVCKNGDAGSEKDVGIFAVRGEVIADFLQDYESNGIPIEMISVGYLGLLNYALYDVRPPKPSVIIDIGSDHTDLLIVDGKRFWVRNLAIAGNDITQALVEKFKLSFEEAEKLKINATKSEQAVKIFGVVQPTLKDLVNEIHRSVGFYKSQAGDVKFEDVYIFGNAARLIGLQKFLQEHLRFQVHVEKGFHRIRVNRDSNVALLQQDFLSFAPAVGHAINALGEGECHVNLLPRERKEAIEFRGKQRIVIASVAATYLVLLGLWFYYDGQYHAAHEAADKARILGPIEEAAKAIAEINAAPAGLDGGERLCAAVRDRRQVVEGLGMLAETWNQLANEETKSNRFENSGWEAKISELDFDQEALNAQKVWLTLADFKPVLLDDKGREIDKPSSKKEEPPPIPAYAFTVRGMTYQQATDVENLNNVEKKIKGTLDEKIKAYFGAAASASEPAVKIKPVSPDPTFIYSRLSGSDAKGRGDEPQGNFFEFELKWYQPAGAVTP